MKIILVNGMPGSGKTTFEELCKNTGMTQVGILSTITPIKELAKQIGWDGQKTPKDRKFLSDLKDLCTDYCDFSINWIKSKINSAIFWSLEDEKKAIIFVDTREINEIERLKKEWNAKSLLVRRAVVENNEQSNHADADVLNTNYDYVLINDGTLENLKEIAKSFMIDLLNEEWESEVK